MKQRFSVGILAIVIAILFSGCFMRDPDELITLPKQSEDYYNLQQAIDEVMKDATYSAPIGGENRQAVQLKDLDGDGNNEAVLFAKTEGEHPLKIYVFNRDGAVFSPIACLEGDGINFDSVQFAQVDGTGGLEIVVSRQLNDGVPQTLSVYATQNHTVTELLTISDYRFVVTDLDQDGAEDVFVLRADAAQRDGAAELYTWKDGQMQSDSQILMGATAEKTVAVQPGKLHGDVSAIFVTSTLDETNLAVDVFAVQDQHLVNLTGAEHALSIPANWSLTDIDADGAMEFPQLLRLSAAEVSDSTDSLALVRWLGMDATGAMSAETVNLHNGSEQWYLNLPDFWQENLCVATRFTDNCHSTILYQQTSAGEPVQVLAIYAYTGEDAQQWASEDGRFPLGSRGSTVYAAKVAEVADMECLRQDAVTSRFHLLPDPTTVVN